jgi:Xaa-Pro dipeptidase
MSEPAPQLQALRARLRERGAIAFLTLDPDQQTWLAGFRALLYSRPIVLLVSGDRTALIVPELEDLHAREHARVDDVRSYNERPGAGTPGSHEELLDELLGALPAGPVAIDEQRLPLAIAESLRARGLELLPFAADVRALLAVKHPHEVEAVRAAGELVAVGVRASLDACRPGTSELEVDAVGAAAILRGASAFGPDATVELLTMTPSGPHRSTLPHVFSSTRRLREGDVLIHTRQLAVGGYRAELERTAVVGAPSAEQARAFQTMLDARQAALEAVAAGVRACDVDRAARERIEAAGFGQYAIHRTGHGIAVAPHEHPHLRHDNPEPLLPGMVLAIEPAFYVPGLGGFRHSDTVLVVEGGCELLTRFPLTLAELAPAG